MSNDITTKQEKFAQLWFSLGNKTEAYRQAYDAENLTDAVINVKAVELSKNGKVSVRYQELMDAARERNETTVDRLDQMAKEAFEIAKEGGQPAAMNQSVTVLAKLHGLNQPEKTDNTNTNKLELVEPTDDMTEEELANAYAENLRKIRGK